jgi:tetratricopeptide (TPR) repeat protein
LKAARGDLERALRLATDSNRTYQQVRARAALASVTASEGRFGDASQTMAVAVDQALANNLEGVAAEALIDLSAILQADRRDEADRDLARAIDLADRAGARRISARARLQRAAAYENAGNPRGALTLVNEILPFLKANRYRRYELLALSIASRAHQRLEEFDIAQKLSRDVLAVARSVKDDAQEALALANLSSMATTLGGYSEALQLRDAAIAIRRRQGNRAALPYDLANRADLLIRLGRREEADAVLTELDAGISAGLQTYVGRARRVAFLRGLSAATALDCDDALRHFGRVASFGPSTESAAVLTPPVSAFCEARLGRRVADPGSALPGDDRTLAGEVTYWQARAASERHDPAGAIATASQGLSLLGTIPNDELRWRLAAAAAASARGGKDERLYSEMTGTARAARERLHSAWKQDFDSYDRRADLTALRKNAGLD